MESKKQQILRMVREHEAKYNQPPIAIWMHPDTLKLLLGFEHVGDERCLVEGPAPYFQGIPIKESRMIAKGAIIVEEWEEKGWMRVKYQFPI